MKQHLADTLIRAPHIVQTQLGEALKTIALCDYPAAWPQLLPTLAAHLSSPDQRTMHGALVCLRVVARKYEFKDESERGPLRELVDATFPRLLAILQGVLASAAQPAAVPPELLAQLPLLLALVCKIFWSVTYMGVPELLVQQGPFLGWMGALHAAITLPLPPGQVPADPDAAADSPWWKARKRALKVAQRLLSRYCSPRAWGASRNTSAHSPVDRQFAELYATNCMHTFLDAHCQLLSQAQAGHYVAPRCLTLALEFVTRSLKVKSCYKRLEGQVTPLLQWVAFPLMCFNDEDAQLWAEDPHEYVRKVRKDNTIRWPPVPPAPCFLARPLLGTKAAGADYPRTPP